jgi:hypothetical protein
MPCLGSDEGEGEDHKIAGLASAVYP